MVLRLKCYPRQCSDREPARLFIIGGKEIKSAEETTQGDPIAMGLNAVSLQPLITHLNRPLALRGHVTNASLKQ